MSVRDSVATFLPDAARPRVLRVASLGLLAFFCGCDQRKDLDAVETFSTSVAVKGIEPFVVTRDLQPGSYLVAVQEDGIDLRTAVAASGSRVELADEIPRHGAQFNVVSLTAPGQVVVEVLNADHSSRQGRAQLRISRWKRAANEPAGEMEVGYAALGAAGRETALSTRESRTRAADHLHEAILHFESDGDDAATAQAQYTLANLQYLARNEWAAAIRAAEAAADAYDSADDTLGMHNAATLRAAAELELASGMKASTQRAEQRALYEGADRRLRDAADYFGEHGLGIRTAYAINMRGIRALYVGNYEEAANLFTAAVGISKNNQDVREQARTLGNLAWVQNRRGYIARAAQEYEALLPMIERARQPYQYAQALANYGFCLIQLGDFDRALALQTEALGIYTEISQDDERAIMLAALGGLYFRIGDTERALETLRSAIIEQERVGDTQGQASTLRVAGNASAALGRHEDALEYLRRSAQIDGNTNSVARTRVMIAGELRELRQLDASAAELEKALGSGNPLVHANALEERAHLRLARGDSAAAIADLRAADKEFLALGLEVNRIEVNTVLSHELLAKRDIAGASAAADEAVAIVSRIRVKSTNPEWRARFLSARYSPYEARISADLAQGGPGDEAATWRAFRTAEAVRARSLADELAVSTEAQAEGNDPAGDELRASLTSLQVRLESRMQRQEIDEVEIAGLRRSIEETRAKLDAKRAAVAASDVKLPESLAQVRARLPADTAVLAYFVGDETSHGWLLTRAELRHVALPGRAELQRAIDEEVARLRARTPAAAGGGLGAVLLTPLVSGIAEKRALVLPDGPLHGVPFAALSLGGHDLFIERFVLGYAPSLALAINKPVTTQARPTRVAVVSDPVYAPDDQRLRLANNGTPGNLRGQRPSSTQLIRLPYSSLEARAVTRAFGERDTIQLSGFDATAEHVRELPTQDLRVLHFATHALARRDSPAQSALYLSEFAADGANIADNRLTVDDIARSRLRASVVVLSGCATGDGNELRGEGVLGLTYGFLANGSNSVVAALWPIEDSSTARFMSEFYRAYRDSGKAAEALREAQLRTRANTATAVWSSFVVRANGFP
jgi:CHAT domain-containing protein/tetratricopeptide (TPR) repeat protein